jgi:hypothetical protein
MNIKKFNKDTTKFFRINNQKFRARSSERLIKGYLADNSEYRKIARDVLKKRGHISRLNKHLKLTGHKPLRAKRSSGRSYGFTSFKFSPI